LQTAGVAPVDFSLFQLDAAEEHHDEGDCAGDEDEKVSET
jgi:hypothetical protein